MHYTQSNLLNLNHQLLMKFAADIKFDDADDDEDDGNYFTEKRPFVLFI